MEQGTGNSACTGYVAGWHRHCKCWRLCVCCNGDVVGDGDGSVTMGGKGLRGGKTREVGKTTLMAVAMSHPGPQQHCVVSFKLGLGSEGVQGQTRGDGYCNKPVANSNDARQHHSSPGQAKRLGGDGSKKQVTSDIT